MVELTNLCNLRCVMCGIWSERPNVRFGIDEFQHLIEQRTIRNVPVLALTGGEPFMMPDFEDYYQRAVLTCPASHINISSNGWYTDRTLDLLKGGARRRTSITISYDGVRSHDTVRRVEGSQSKLLETATRIRSEYPEVGITLKLTVTNDNFLEIEDTARQCRDLGIAFRFKTLEKLQCHQSRSPSDIDGPEYDEDMLAKISDQSRAVLDMGIDTNDQYIRRLIDKNSTGNAPCSCSPRTLFIGIDGNVFLCRRKEPIGNLRDASMDELWQSHARKQRTKEMGTCTGAPLGLGFTHA